MLTRKRWPMCKSALALLLFTSPLLFRDLTSSRLQSVTMIRTLNNFSLYETFAYHISLLRQFVSLHTRNDQGRRQDRRDSDENISSVHGNNVWNALRKKRGLDSSGHRGDADASTKSTMSGGGMRRNLSVPKLTDHAALQHQFSMPVGGTPNY